MNDPVLLFLFESFKYGALIIGVVVFLGILFGSVFYWLELRGARLEEQRKEAQAERLGRLAKDGRP
jgi:hypothetical protein